MNIWRLSIYKFVLVTPRRSQDSSSWLYFLKVVYCARPQMPFPALEILIEFEEADQRIRGFVLLTQKHLLCKKTSRKCLLTSCYFCVTVTVWGWVCMKRSIPWFLPGGTGPWVSFISEGFKVLWRHLPIFIASRWIFSINQNPRICFTRSFDLNSSAGQPNLISHGNSAPPVLHMSFGVPTLA